MIRKKTVFVLGAGASYPYGYPLGRELISTIERYGKERQFLNSVDRAFPFSIGSVQSKASAQFQIFTGELANSGVLSVDSFVSAKNEYYQYAKFAIASALISCEYINPSNLALEDRGSEDWYRYLYNELMVNSRNDTYESLLSNNRVKFVTFNYDVSLDKFFLRAIYSKYGSVNFKEFFEQFQIIHVHGKIRKFQWEAKGDDVGYWIGKTAKVEPEKAAELSKGIVFLHEGKLNEQLLLAQQALSEAERIVFLGFAFHDVNVDKLGIEWKNLTFEDLRQC
jgi:hypothetical protein